MTEFTGGINIPKDDIDFGDYVLIEQKRYGVPNEMFQFKVIGSFKSNTYCDVPMDAGDHDQKWHPEVVGVLNVICCGIDETKVDTVRKSDVSLIKSRADDHDKIAQEYAARLTKVADKIPVQLLEDIQKRMGDWAMSGRPMSDPYIGKLVDNAETLAKMIKERKQ